ncbi:Ig-like domain repeat protein [Nocardioides sp. SYSU D00038]|uniref:Ig-like domain repeat protein n=1 Tax=Nocardioides sp. SYSU D00038 TaxID=2812554 RepID=UPI001968935A|nr:Ig-like domain repeat protein [Nocardioides sp. SYSU D00038]
MKHLRQGVGLALIGAGLAVVTGTTPAASAPPAAAVGSSLVQQLRAEARGSVAASTLDATGKVGFLRAGTDGDLLPAREASGRDGAVAKTRAYLDKYAGAFGARPEQLVRGRVVADDLGWTVDYAQSYRGVPVFGALLRAHVDRDGDLTSVNGFVAPALNVDVEPSRTAEQAAQTAINVTRAHAPEGVEVGELEVTSNQLAVYRQGVVKQEAGANTLAWVVEVTDGHAVRQKVFVDAHSQKVLNRYSMIDSALDRELREAFLDDNGTPDDEDDDFVGFETVWEEGQPTDGLNEDQKNLVASAGEAYWFFKNAFNRDSYDGNGARMVTVNNDPRIACPNANWNGITTNYCDGVTSDDVVSHEWGHAYTEHTWGGIYQWQSGALNESYSDIWGETVDLINNREDEGEGDINAKRPDGLCSQYTRGAIGVTINSPAEVAGPCAGAAAAAFGPVFDKQGVTADLVVGTDEPTEGTGSTTDGCSPFTNAAEIDGKFVYVDRGTCAFADKIAHAEEAGATGIIFGNNAPGVGSVAGQSDLYGAMVTQEDGAKIKSVDGVLNITVKDVETAEKADSYRWLVSEKSPAFGGAIRDMWNPTCYGDPGKVSDVEYVCSTDDQGGVHGNSGVPNHGYALVVDGGSFNGQTVSGIGLTKAAAIYYRAMTAYMTPVSSFADHADALEAACADLSAGPGATIRELSTDPNTSNAYDQKVTAADCAEVTKMIAAVELRRDPVQCDFKPQLDPNTPGSACGAGFTDEVAFEDDFEGGLEGWELDGESVFGYDQPLLDWRSTNDLPAGNRPAGSQTAAFGPAPDRGACNGDSSDFSSVVTMTSPEFEVGETGAAGAALRFDHNIQTELGYDGGNVQLSVNGGAFEAIPAAAYTFNGPTQLATEEDESTNPLAGQPGFTGTDGGKIISDWGTSVVDLAGAGVAAGDTLRIRFAIGRDGCGGVKGWWVDNLRVTTCVEKAAATLEATAPASAVYGAPRAVTATVTGAGEAPTGTVTVKEGSTTLGTASLSGGSATVALPTTMAAGAHALTVEYGGDAAYAGATDSVSLTVTKASSRTVAAANPRKVAKGKAFRAKVTVTSKGSTPTGKVDILLKGRKIGSGTLRGGTVTIKVTKRLGVGVKTLTARYAGTANVAGSQDTFKVTVTKPKKR